MWHEPQCQLFFSSRPHVVCDDIVIGIRICDKTSIRPVNDLAESSDFGVMHLCALSRAFFPIRKPSTNQPSTGFQGYTGGGPNILLHRFSVVCTLRIKLRHATSIERRAGFTHTRPSIQHSLWSSPRHFFSQLRVYNILRRN